MLSVVLPTAILIVPAITVTKARQDAWLSVSLSLRFPGQTLCEYAEDILDNVLGKQGVTNIKL